MGSSTTMAGSCCGRPASATASTPSGGKFDEPDGRRMLPARLAARGVAGADIGRLQRTGWLDLGGRRVTLEEVSELPRPGQSFALVMDTAWCDAAIDLAGGVDLLVCESTVLHADAHLAEPRRRGPPTHRRPVPAVDGLMTDRSAPGELGGRRSRNEATPSRWSSEWKQRSMTSRLATTWSSKERPSPAYSSAFVSPMANGEPTVKRAASARAAPARSSGSTTAAT